MSTLIGSNGKSYEIPDQNKAAALATGKFTEAPAPAAPPPPTSEAEQLDRYAVETGKLSPQAVQPKPQDLPVTLKDTKTGQDQEVPESQANALVASGTHTAPNVQLIGSNGKAYSIPEENQAAALQSGKFRLATSEEQAAQRQTNYVEETGGTGLKPVVGGAIDAALTGVAKHNPLTQVGQQLEDPELRQIEGNTVEQVSQEYPVAYGTGAVTGEVGSALATGEVAKGLSTAAELSGLGKTIAEGAIYSAEPVAQAVINKDPKAAAEALALGVGLNVGLHGLFSAAEAIPGAVGRGLGKADAAITNSNITQEEAENLIGKQVLGLSPGKIADVREQIAPALKAAGVTSEDIASGKALEKIQALEEFGPRIGKAIKELDTLPQADRAAVIQDGLNQAQEDVRKLLPSEVLERESAEANIQSSKLALKEAATQTERLAARESLSEAESRLEQLGKLSPSALQAKRALQPILDEIAAAARKGSFEEIQKLKQFTRGQTNFGADNGFANQLKKQAGAILNDNIIKIEDLAATKLGSPEVIQGLREQRAAYTFHKLLGDAADRMAAKDLPHSTVDQLSHFHASRHSLPIIMLHMIGVPAPLSIAAGLGMPLLKNYAAKQALGSAAKKLLGESTAPATNTVLHALQTQEFKINESAKNLLSSLASGSAAKSVSSNSGLKDFLPNNGSGYSHAQQLNSLRTAVNEHTSDPSKLADHLGDLTAPLHQEGLTQVAQEYTNHQVRLLKVLQTILPKDPKVLQAHPFAAKPDISEISEATKAKYQRALSIASDPTVLLEMVKSNNITQGDVAIAAAVNPATLQKMRDALLQEAIKTKPDMTYQQRLSMGILMGENLDASTVPASVELSTLQASYAAPPPSGSTGKPSKSHKLSAKAQDNLTDSALTVSQKAQGL